MMARAHLVVETPRGNLVAGIKRRRWDEAELAQRAKGNAQKVAIAVRLRAETAVTVQWMAERLQMGAPGYVHHLLDRQRKAEGQ